MITRKIVRLVERRLGESAETVAATLERLGYKGIPGDSDRCPIARYLTYELDKYGNKTGYTCEAGDHTPAVYAFMELFDNGSFSQLDERTSRESYS